MEFEFCGWEGFDGGFAGGFCDSRSEKEARRGWPGIGAGGAVSLM
jgi:hypothetical protein